MMSLMTRTTTAKIAIDPHPPMRPASRRGVMRVSWRRRGRFDLPMIRRLIE